MKKLTIILFSFVPMLSLIAQEAEPVSEQSHEMRDKVKKIDKLCVNCLWVNGRLFLNGTEITRGASESQGEAEIEVVVDADVTQAGAKVISLAAMQDMLKSYGEKIAKLEAQIQELLNK